MTRGPANPISAFGSAMITSPNIATLAVTPPRAEGVSPLILATAALLGLEELLTVGGAQAVAWLALGEPQVDLIAGPGNRFVAERMLEGLGVKPATTSADGRVLRHVVLFKFKDSSTPADVERIVAAFRGLPAKIDAIKGFEWGTDVSPEGKSQGFTHCFVVTFATEAGRDAYLPHPAHGEFVSIVGPHVDKVCVVDFWTQATR